MPHQLELPLTRRSKTKCTASSDAIIPGLDASLCRCDYCLTRSDGIWWVDVDQRLDCLNKKKHKIPYLIEVYRRQTVGVGHDDDTKETEAQNAKRKHAQWAGQKFKQTNKSCQQQQLLDQ